MAKPIFRRLIPIAVISLAVAACAGSDVTDSTSAPTIATTTTVDQPTTTTEGAPTTTAPVLDVNPTIEIVGSPLPAHDPDTENASGAFAPEVVGASFDGTPIEIRHDGENYKMIVFLAHWCSHCQDEVPVVKDWLAEYDLGGNIEILSVSTGERQDRGNWPPVDWLEREEWPIPVIEDSLEADIAISYGLTAFPYWVFLDKDGSLLLRANGLSAEGLTAITDQIKSYDEDGAA